MCSTDNQHWETMDPVRIKNGWSSWASFELCWFLFTMSERPRRKQENNLVDRQSLDTQHFRKCKTILSFSHWSPFNWFRAASDQFPFSLLSHFSVLCSLPLSPCHSASTQNGPEEETHAQNSTQRLLHSLVPHGPPLRSTQVHQFSEMSIHKIRKLSLPTHSYPPQPNFYSPRWKGVSGTERTDNQALICSKPTSESDGL